LCGSPSKKQCKKAQAPATSTTGKGYSQHSLKNKEYEPLTNNSAERGGNKIDDLEM